MFLKTVRFITIMFTALGMAVAFCHFLEMPAKLTSSNPLPARLRAGWGNF